MINQERVKELFDYNEETGVIIQVIGKNDEVSGWPMVLAVPLRVASPLDWLVS